jgi:hypothetical protein
MGKMICNCNDPYTKETQGKDLCHKVGGVDRYGVSAGVEQIEQYMVC